jgi:hypothetical protein
MGLVLVVAFAASAAVEFPMTAMTATRRSINSANADGSRSRS